MDPVIEKIKERSQYDNEMFRDSLGELASVLNAEFIKPHPAEAVKRVMSYVLRAVGLPMPEIPEDITERDKQLSYLLNAVPAMRRRVELVGKWWKDAEGALLGSTTSGELVAIVKAGLSGYCYVDKTGKRVKITAKTAKDICADAFCFYRPFPKGKLSFKDIVVFMLKQITMADVLFVVFLSLAISVIGMGAPGLNNYIFDRMIPEGLESGIFPIAAVFFGLAFSTALISMSRSALISRFSGRIDISLQSAIMMRLFSLPASFFKHYSAGDLSTRTMGVTTICKEVSVDVLTTGISALFSLVYILQMVNYAPALVVPGLISVLASLLFSIYITLKMVKLSRKKMKLNAKLSGLIFQLFTGVPKIRLAGAEQRAFAKWSSLYGDSARLEYKPALILRLNTAISTLISLSGVLLLFYFAGTSRVSPADFISFNVAYGAVSGAVAQLALIAASVASIKPAMEMVEPILTTKPEGLNDDLNQKVVTKLSGDIDVNHVTFRYDQGGPTILNDISLHIEGGEYVAIVGKTGCGKSTLLRLLLGFESPETGSVYYDGQDLQNLNLSSVRQNIGTCLQNGQLFSGDIFSNIIIAAPEKIMQDAWDAAELAGVADDIRAMPMGMHTFISENGGISGGQKQRLLIARAIVGKPRILFFDEATSALDNITQKHVSDSIAGLNCTRLVIAHRLSTIKEADRIVMLEDGAIIEEGSYQNLIDLNGKFAEMIAKQRLDSD